MDTVRVVGTVAYVYVGPRLVALGVHPLAPGGMLPTAMERWRVSTSLVDGEQVEWDLL